MSRQPLLEIRFEGDRVALSERMFRGLLDIRLAKGRPVTLHNKTRLGLVQRGMIVYFGTGRCELSQKGRRFINFLDNQGIV